MKKRVLVPMNKMALKFHKMYAFFLTIETFRILEMLCNSYTMGCPPARGDNPRALASHAPQYKLIAVVYALFWCSLYDRLINLPSVNYCGLLLE